jgi:hypothetical protein
MRYIRQARGQNLRRRARVQSAPDNSGQSAFNDCNAASLLGGDTPIIPTFLTGMINPCNCWMPSMHARKRRGQAIGRFSVVTK